MARRTIDGAAGFAGLVGVTIGTSEWIAVDQAMIDAFGTTTRDEQWIHMDPERAANGPFGATVAHGFLVLSLIPGLASQTYEATGFGARVNYGLEKVRFPQALRAGESVRDTVSVAGVEEVATGVRVTFDHRIESTAGGRPVCVAQTVTLFTPASAR